tara:strand:- start:26341 stop:27918 length:1578 start_codon:yes stop_codon:yes gene_type:complete
MEIFGFEINRKKPTATTKSFVPQDEQGAIDSIRGGGYYGTYFDVEGIANTEELLIKRYRDISMMADVDAAIEDIVNDSLSNLEDEKPVTIDIDNVDTSDKVKKAISEEFETVLRLFDFNNRAQDYFRRWYIDGRIYFHKVIDTASPKQGIKDIRYIDPRKIRLIREIKKEKDAKTGVQFIKDTKEYFVYDSKGIATKPGQYSPSVDDKALKISKDAIAYCPSGLVDQDKNIPLSFLHKAIRPANQLRMMENAVVIYRITRAPERRIFYVDTGNLPKVKAEQYLKDMMDRYRNKLVYDSQTGEIRDDKKFMSMLEDFWMPRREGGRGTEIQTLPGGQNLGETGDVDYFQKKLYQSLNVPVSRLEQAGGLNFGRSAEINRDELKFTKFIAKLRKRFSILFDDMLRTQLILKGVIKDEDWADIREEIQYRFASDAFYTESKEQEILRSRVEVLNGVSSFIGTLYSKRYVQKEILRQTDEEIIQIEKDIQAEPALQRQYQWSPFSPASPEEIKPGAEEEAPQSEAQPKE